MVAAALAALAFAAAPFAAAGGDRAPALLVQLTPRAACSEATTLVQAGATAVAPELQLYRLAASRARTALAPLRAHDAVRSVTPDRPMGQLAFQAADPLSGEEWWRAAIGLAGLTPPGPGKPVTLVDSGVDLTHPDFAGRNPGVVALNAQEPAPVGGRHGTAVASLIGAAENGAGFVGIYPQALLRSWDASLGEGRSLETSDIVAGIMAAARGGPGVINLSLGGPRDTVIEQAVGEAWAAGSVVVAASGNDGQTGSPLSYPAALPHVLTIAATNRSDAPASFSSSSRFVDLAAPGEGVLVAGYPVGGWEAESGTSFSAPLVSGAAAWVWTARPDLDNSQLFEVLRRSARDVGTPGRDPQTGFGILNVASALSYPPPARDPLEPNEDVEYVKPGGYFETGVRPLTTQTSTRATIAARLDRTEDPRDVYRVFLPARREAVVTTSGNADVDVAVWGPSTISVDQGAGAARLAVGVRSGSASERVVVKSSPRARWGYVAVVPGRRPLEASYTLTVTTRAPAPAARR
jgi:subtilisin family serine protease